MGPISSVKSYDKGLIDVQKCSQGILPSFHDDFVYFFVHYPECEGGYADAGLCEGGDRL